MKCSKKCNCDTESGTVWCKDVTLIKELPFEKSLIENVYLKDSLVKLSMIMNESKNIKRLYLWKSDVIDNEKELTSYYDEDDELYIFNMETDQEEDNKCLKQMVISFLLALGLVSILFHEDLIPMLANHLLRIQFLLLDNVQGKLFFSDIYNPIKM